MRWLVINPRTAGGGAVFRPPGFSQIAKKRRRAKFAIAVQSTIWHISKKNDDPMTPTVTPPGHINPRPAGVWIVTRPAGGGGAKAPPPEILPNYWTDFQNSNAIR